MFIVLLTGKQLKKYTKMKFFKLFLTLTILINLTSCSKENDEIYLIKITEQKNTYSNIEFDILNLVNNYRESLGINRLSKLDIVSSVALSHTKYMVETGEVSHNNFDQRAQNLIENAGAKSVGENIAYGYNSAQGTVTGWLNSDSHRKVIESASYTHFGISTKSNAEGRNYFTQIFIAK